MLYQIISVVKTIYNKDLKLNNTLNQSECEVKAAMLNLGSFWLADGRSQ